jgi:hypothetical protein
MSLETIGPNALTDRSIVLEADHGLRTAEAGPHTGSGSPAHGP